MYEKFFQLRERPFALSPDPEYLFPSRVHQEALNYLRYGIEGRAGFVVITGEIGSGKTTLLQTVLSRLDASTVVSRIVNTMLDPRELLEAILLDFNLDMTGRSKPLIVRSLADYLVAQRNAGRLVLLVIDEAQNLSLPALEEIRMLSNLETEKSKLMQIVLIGQPELRAKLNSPQLEQLRQRVTVSYHLQPLGPDETHAYVNYRLRRAAIAGATEFPAEATALMHARSGGIPRTINIIADATLLTAYGLDQRIITTSIVAETIAELDATGVLAPTGTGAVIAAAPLVPPVTGEAAAREVAVAARERELRAREDALLARQRVLEEESRLLREAQRATQHASHVATGPAADAVHATGTEADPGVAAEAVRGKTVESLPSGNTSADPRTAAIEPTSMARAVATPPSPAENPASESIQTKPVVAAPPRNESTGLSAAAVPSVARATAAPHAAASPSVVAATPRQATAPPPRTDTATTRTPAAATTPARVPPAATSAATARARTMAAPTTSAGVGARPTSPARAAASGIDTAPPPWPRRRQIIFTEWEPKRPWWTRVWRSLFGEPEAEGF